MTKAAFTTEDNYVTVSHDDEFGERVSTTYFVPMSGGHVRIYDAAGRHPQVCVGLSSRGNTLTATPETLPAVIRREWRRAMRHAQ